MLLKIDYHFLKGWKPVIVTTLILELIFLSIIYFHPENMDWIGSEYFSVGNLLRFVFIDQFLIECITVWILFRLIRLYGHFFKLNELHLNTKEIGKYELKFLPVFLLAFFVFAPITLTVRFLYHYLPDLNWGDYFNEYVYSVELYFSYLPPVLLVGYTILNVNLIRLYNQQLHQTSVDLTKQKQQMTRTRLWASNDSGELFLDIEKILWIERKDRKTLAAVESEEYRLKETITELEEKLDPDQFVRISRSVIVSLEHVLNYSFWENDKYIVRIKNSNKEFVMSRERLKKIKDKFLTSAVQ